MKNKSGLIEYDDALPILNAYQNRILGYELNIQHSGLGTFKRLTAPDMESLKIKAELLANSWVDKWEKIEEKRIKQERIENTHSKAEEITALARQELDAVNNILRFTLDIDDTIEWESLKSNLPFGTPHPKKEYQLKKDQIIPPKQKPKIDYLPKPERNSPRYNRGLSFFEKLIPSLKRKKIEEDETLFSDDLTKWIEDCNKVDEENAIILNDYELEMRNYTKELADIEKKYENALKKWLEEKERFEINQKTYNENLDVWRSKYFAGDESAILEYCSQVLNNSKYPDSFPHNFELMYRPETKTLVVEYQMPKLGDIPTLKEVKFIQSKNELKETHLPEAQTKALYDKVLYEISLRSLHEIFEADQGNWVEAIAFNGWVKEINPATGKQVNNCIMTVYVKKDVFTEIDLSKVDPKTCFKGLKGVAASKLNSLTPVQPILTMVTDDPRFVDSYKIMEKVEKGDNLAAMDWEDFEHLIRELFEKEFKSSGGEVKITQASRDGGVDAVAFDPDPIRGGKIVIQAKRYSNTVGVSAVRDLYGTIMNEGATKGILVTTADYGPDAYEFAKGKPLTLLNGSNLLSLLAKHGQEARINLQEAKAIMKEK